MHEFSKHFASFFRFESWVRLGTGRRESVKVAGDSPRDTFIPSQSGLIRSKLRLKLQLGRKLGREIS